MEPDCQLVAERLSPWLSGECTPEEAASLLAHVERCPECAAMKLDMERLLAALGEMPLVPAPEDFMERLRSRLPSETRAAPRRLPWLLAASLLVAALGWFALWSPSPAPPSGRALLPPAGSRTGLPAREGLPASLSVSARSAPIPGEWFVLAVELSSPSPLKQAEIEVHVPEGWRLRRGEQVFEGGERALYQAAPSLTLEFMPGRAGRSELDLALTADGRRATWQVLVDVE